MCLPVAPHSQRFGSDYASRVAFDLSGLRGALNSAATDVLGDGAPVRLADMYAYGGAPLRGGGGMNLDVVRALTEEQVAVRTFPGAATGGGESGSTPCAAAIALSVDMVHACAIAGGDVDHGIPLVKAARFPSAPGRGGSTSTTTTAVWPTTAPARVVIGLVGAVHSVPAFVRASQHDRVAAMATTAAQWAALPAQLREELSPVLVPLLMDEVLGEAVVPLATFRAGAMDVAALARAIHAAMLRTVGSQSPLAGSELAVLVTQTGLLRDLRRGDCTLRSAVDAAPELFRLKEGSDGRWAVSARPPPPQAPAFVVSNSRVNDGPSSTFSSAERSRDAAVAQARDVEQPTLSQQQQQQQQQQPRAPREQGPDAPSTVMMTSRPMSRSPQPSQQSTRNSSTHRLATGRSVVQSELNAAATSAHEDARPIRRAIQSTNPGQRSGAAYQQEQHRPQQSPSASILDIVSGGHEGTLALSTPAASLTSSTSSSTALMGPRGADRTAAQPSRGVGQVTQSRAQQQNPSRDADVGSARSDMALGNNRPSQRREGDQQAHNAATRQASVDGERKRDRHVATSTPTQGTNSAASTHIQPAAVRTDTRRGHPSPGSSSPRRGNAAAASESRLVQQEPHGKPSDAVVQSHVADGAPPQLQPPSQPQLEQPPPRLAHTAKAADGLPASTASENGEEHGADTPPPSPPPPAVAGDGSEARIQAVTPAVGSLSPATREVAPTQVDDVARAATSTADSNAAQPAAATATQLLAKLNVAAPGELQPSGRGGSLLTAHNLHVLLKRAKVRAKVRSSVNELVALVATNASSIEAGLSSREGSNAGPSAPTGA